MIHKQGLYLPENEHDSCGVGFVVNINGKADHQIVKDGIQICKNLVHRGALGGDMKTGDGAGMLMQVPHAFFQKEAKKLKFTLPSQGSYGIGFLFLPQNKERRIKIENAVKSIIKAEKGSILGWRDVPVCPDCLGEIALESMPYMKQIFVSYKGISDNELERKLYITRKVIEKEALKLKYSIEDFYISSLSAKTICYKGMFVATQFEAFFPDLRDPNFHSAFALIHQRYSTNTFPSWPLAQPFRYIAHNGEINTLRGNVNKMNARQSTLSSELFGNEMKKLFPIITPGGSDSGMFDNAFELLVAGGRSIEHSIMMMIPEAFGPKYHISTDKRNFYEYHTTIMEPWDGPASIAFTDGSRIGAVLDRNGLRPSRYVITKSGKMVLASEVGVLTFPAEDVVEKGRLAPGRMILVDMEKKRVIKDNEIKAAISRQKPYRRWLEKKRILLKELFQAPQAVVPDKDSIITKQKAFGYTLEDLNMIIAPMAENGQEPVGSMGNDSALAVLSEKPQLLYKYFKQTFAQVTNPPIDPYRENLVMSLMHYTGREGNLLDETPEHCHQLKLPHPVLTNEDIERLSHIDSAGIKSIVIPIIFEAKKGMAGIKQALKKICATIEEKVDEGYSMVVLSDRNIDKEHAPIPALLAVSSVHHHLVKSKRRHLTGLVIETGEAKEVMDFATLIGFGASAINPYLAFESLALLKEQGKIDDEITMESAIDNYITAIKKGLLKIMSKIGVSTIRSYKSAQLFEAVGLNLEFIKNYFPGLNSQVEGIGLAEITKEITERHLNAFNENQFTKGILESGGFYHFRKHSEKHLLTPEAVSTLQKAVRTGDYNLFKKYTEIINSFNTNLCTLRGLFKFKKSKPVPLDEVEPVESIVKRFVTSAMSFGSISKEAHETMAIAMNRLGAMSNSGEGGEDEVRYKDLSNGDSMKSAVKQVASGRFGVNSHYLVNSKELQIKMAQGAKPGEGGQLPGYKVNETIAKVRHSTPGVMLISPPPHHDIYSIEDLAQLIYDLKNANPDARVSVKLVSEIGVGTIAAGVAKGKADMVLISGHDGGTGASPLSSVKYAGSPWEIGLAETQQTLVLNKLRDKIRVQVDGQLRTGRDVIIGALMGAEEFGFGTVSLITMGCIMMRKCHLNTCPVGVATQDPKLRGKFTGKPEHIVNFMKFIAQDTREIMAELGFRKFDDMIGQIDRIETNKAIKHWKTKGLDFSKVFYKPKLQKGGSYRCVKTQGVDLSLSIESKLIQKAKQALESKKKVKFTMDVKNCNRTIGSTLSAEISKKYGSKGLPADTIHCKFNGVAGQSFAAFLARGVTFELEGDANDYMGKGLSGGKVIIYPPKGTTYRPHRNIITGNVNLFGATAGEVYIHGMAGERFAVRNSGALAVVEGIGDHGCEYMTGGCVVVLGETGVNFAAGMSGGIAYVLDENQLFDTKCNLEMVDLEAVTNEEDKKVVLSLLKNHVKYTSSKYAKRILENWTEMIPLFVKVFPIDYKKALGRIKKAQAKETEIVSVTEEVFL